MSKLIICDVDGTLIPFGTNDVPAILIKAFHQLSRVGHHTTLATGKPFERSQNIAHDLHMQGPLICANGALIRDLNGHILHQDFLPITVVNLVTAHFGTDHTTQLYFELGNELVYLRNPLVDASTWRHAKNDWQKIPRAIDIDDLVKPTLQKTICKIGVSVNEHDRERVYSILKHLLGAQATLYAPKPDIVDIVPAHSDKGRGVTWLMKYLHVDASDVIVIGDGDNDLAMFKVASQDITFGYAAGALQALATTIVADQTELARYILDSLG